MDRNHDRVITREEWRGSAQSFKVHDWNGDGKLSGDEVRVGAARDDRASDADNFDYDDREYVFDDWTDRGFRALDYNRDSRITRDEWHFDREGFRRADHNNDGVISRAEFLDRGRRKTTTATTAFPYLDANRDGRISRDEWHGSPSRFTVLDDNRDGFISRTEMLGTAAPPESVQQRRHEPRSRDHRQRVAVVTRQFRPAATSTATAVSRRRNSSGRRRRRNRLEAPPTGPGTSAGSSKAGRPAVKSARTTGHGTSKARPSSSRPIPGTSQAWAHAPTIRRDIARRSARAYREGWDAGEVGRIGLEVRPSTLVCFFGARVLT